MNDPLQLPYTSLDAVSYPYGRRYSTDQKPYPAMSYTPERMTLMSDISKTIWFPYVSILCSFPSWSLTWTELELRPIRKPSVDNDFGFGFELALEVEQALSSAATPRSPPPKHLPYLPYLPTYPTLSITITARMLLPHILTDSSTTLPTVEAVTVPGRY